MRKKGTLSPLLRLCSERVNVLPQPVGWGIAEAIVRASTKDPPDAHTNVAAASLARPDSGRRVVLR